MITLIQDVLVVFGFFEQVFTALPFVIQLIFICSSGLGMVFGMLYLLRR